MTLLTTIQLMNLFNIQSPGPHSLKHSEPICSLFLKDACSPYFATEHRQGLLRPVFSDASRRSARLSDLIHWVAMKRVSQRQPHFFNSTNVL